MTDQQQVTISLHLVLETCTSVLTALEDHSISSEVQSSSLNIIYKDLQSILTLIYSSTTKLALALKPSSPTYKAAFPVLQDIPKYTSALLHCAKLYIPELYGKTLSEEVISTTHDVIFALKCLISVFLKVEHTNSRENSGKAGEEYLINTASVHELIDKARSKNGLSLNNRIAVRKRWVQGRGCLEDGLRELSEILEDKNGEDEDGWDELGLGSSASMTEAETRRTKEVHIIFKLSVILFKRIQQDFLSESSHLASGLEHKLDAFLVPFSHLQNASDEVIASLYPPQDEELVSKELRTFQDHLNLLRQSVDALLPHNSLEDTLANLNLGEQEASEIAWYRTCFDQLLKVRPIPPCDS